jgi:hypothetical protein
MRLSDRIASLEAARLQPAPRPDGLAVLAKLEAILDGMGIEVPPADAPQTITTRALLAELRGDRHGTA